MNHFKHIESSLMKFCTQIKILVQMALILCRGYEKLNFSSTICCPTYIQCIISSPVDYSEQCGAMSGSHIFLYLLLSSPALLSWGLHLYKIFPHTQNHDVTLSLCHCHCHYSLSQEITWNNEFQGWWKR